MPHVIKYWLVTAENAKAFNEKVNEFIRNGWQPHGGHSILAGMYAQSVVAHDSNVVRSSWHLIDEEQG